MARRPRQGPRASAIGLSQPRAFYKIAAQRWADANFLLSAGRTTAAVYLAGYAIECALKALILNASPDKSRVSIVQGFRGKWAHDYDELRAIYVRIPNSTRFSQEVAARFSRVNGWGTDLRYQALPIALEDAVSFLEDSEAILAWVGDKLPNRP